MPRGQMNKDELMVRVMKKKHALYERVHHGDKSEEWHQGAQQMLSDVLDILDEYRF